MPNVSVIITTYQRANLVSQAIESVLAQTYTDYEIIVVNDGSTDNTREVLARFGDKITVIHQENKGLSVARNTGIMAAAARYIAFLDDDDLWIPNKLEKQIAFLESHPHIGLISSNTFFFDEFGILDDTWIQTFPTPPVQNCLTLFVRNFMPVLTVIVRKKCLDEVGLFDETMRSCEDYDLWLRIAEKWSIHFMSEPLGQCRKSANSMSTNQERMLLSTLRVKEKAFRRNPDLRKSPLIFLDTYFYNFYLTIAYMYIGCYQGAKARHYLRRYRRIRDMNSIYEWLWMISFPLLNSSPTSNSVLASTNN